MRPVHKCLLACALASMLILPVARRDADASGPTAPEPPPAAVSVSPAVDLDFSPMHWAPGSVISRSDARVAGEQSGRVSRIAEVGERVAAGEALAVLDDSALRLREREIEADAARIRAQLDMARLQERRYAQLAEQQSIARAQYDQLRADSDMLTQEHARVLAQLAQVKLQRSQMVVRAPFSGIVVERHAQPGEYLAQGAPVARLVDPDAQDIRVRAPVDLAAHLTPGTSVRVRSGDDVHAMSITALVPVGDEASRQLELRIAAGGRPWAIGTAVEVGMPRAQARSVVAVPRDAMILRNGGEFVIRVGADGNTERLLVERGDEIDGMVEVRGKVAVGDQLVVRGGERLSPGQRVRIEPGDAALAAR